MKYLSWSSTKCSKDTAIKVANTLNPILPVAHQVEALRITEEWWGLVSNHPGTEAEINKLIGEAESKNKEGA